MGESLEFFQVPGPLFREKVIYDNSPLALLRASLFQFPEPIQGVKLKIFPSPRAYMKKARNFFNFQGLYTGRKVYMTTRTLFCSVLYSSTSQSHIFLHIFPIFLHISHIFLHVPSYFPHASSLSPIDGGDAHGFPIVTRVSRKKVGLRKFKTVSYQLCCNPLLFIYTTLVRTIE